MEPKKLEEIKNKFEGAKLLIELLDFKKENSILVYLLNQIPELIAEVEQLQKQSDTLWNLLIENCIPLEEARKRLGLDEEK